MGGLCSMCMRPTTAGAGPALLEAVVDPEESVALWVAHPNPRAQEFYRKHGFVPDGTAEIEGGVREMRMVRGMQHSRSISRAGSRLASLKNVRTETPPAGRSAGRHRAEPVPQGEPARGGRQLATHLGLLLLLQPGRRPNVHLMQYCMPCHLALSDQRRRLAAASGAGKVGFHPFVCIGRIARVLGGKEAIMGFIQARCDDNCCLTIRGDAEDALGCRRGWRSELPMRWAVFAMPRRYTQAVLFSVAFPTGDHGRRSTRL